MVLQTLLTRCVGSTSTKSMVRQLSSSSIHMKSEGRKPTAQMPTLLDIGSRSIFNSEDDILRQSARRFFQEEVAPEYFKWEKDGHPSREIWKRAGDNGFLGVTIPTDHGGLGATYKEACIIAEEQAYVNVAAPSFGLHADIILPYISRYGNKEQIEKYMPDLIAGRKIASIAMSEPGAGSDLQGIRTSAKKKGDDYILNGSKTFITNGYLANVIIVVAITDPNAKSPAHGTSLFIVEDTMKGFSKGKPLKKLGGHAQDTCELFFDDIVLHKSQLLGEENHGFYYLMSQLPRERMGIAVGACAVSEWMFEETRKYVKDRKVFGEPLSGKQTVQHKLAEMKTEICVGRAFTDQCIELHAKDELDSTMASMAKYYLSDLSNRVAYQCVQLHGGMGYMWETPVSRAFVNCRVLPIYGGSNEIMKEIIARKIVKD